MRLEMIRLVIRPVRPESLLFIKGSLGLEYPNPISHTLQNHRLTRVLTELIRHSTYFVMTWLKIEPRHVISNNVAF